MSGHLFHFHPSTTVSNTLLPSSVCNLMTLIVFAHEARLVSSSSLIPVKMQRGRMAASDHAGVVLMSVSVYGTLRDSTALLMWRCLLHFDMTIESMESWLHLTLLPLENGRKLDTWHSRMPLSRHLATASEPLSYNILHNIFEGSLEVKLPTIWTVEKQRWEESEEKRSEERRCRCAKR